MAQRVGRDIDLLLHDRKISSPHRDSIPDRPARSSVAIPTELPGPIYIYIYTHTHTHTHIFFQNVKRQWVAVKNLLLAVIVRVVTRDFVGQARGRV